MQNHIGGKIDVTKNLATQKSRRTRITQGVHQHSHFVEYSKIFSQNQRPSEKEILKYREIFYSLILKSKSNDRKLISQYLSRNHYTPRPIAVYFGMDDIDIAAPMLLFSPVFEAADFKRIIEKQDLQHASIIARRNDLETQTIHELLLKDDQDGTLRSLITRNPSITKTAEVSELLSKSRDILCSEARMGMQPEAMVPTQNMQEQSEQVQNAQEQKPKDLTDELLSVARKDSPYRSYEVKASLSPSAKLAKRMLGYARDHDHQGLTLLIHKTCLLEHEKIDSLLMFGNTGLQTTLLRALDIPVKEASQLMLLINSRIGRKADVFKQIMEKYQNLDLDECRAHYEKFGAVFGELQPKKSKDDVSRKHFSTLITQRRNSILSTDGTTSAPQEQAQDLKRA